MKFFVKIIIAFFLLSTISFLLYIFIFSKPEPVLPKNPQVLDANSILAKVQPKINEVNNSFFIDRDYNKAIKSVRSEAAEYKKGQEEYGLFKLREAAYLFLTNQEKEGLSLFAEIFNTNSYSIDLRTDALFYASWHTSSINFEYLSLENAKKWYFAPDKFGTFLGIQNPETEITNLSQANGFILKAFSYTSENFSKPKDKLLSQSFYFLTYINSYNLSKGNSLNQFLFDFLIFTNEFNNSVSINEPYDYFNLIAYLNISLVYNYLYYQGAVSFPEFRSLSYQIFNYADLDSSNHITLNSNSEHVFRYACAFVKNYNFKLNKNQKQEIKILLEKYIYTLADEDLAKRNDIRKISQLNSYCHKEFIYLATMVDTKLQDILISKVGGSLGSEGWKEKDFQIQSNFFLDKK